MAALRAQLQGRLLASDMRAFKAANPGACLLGECQHRRGGGSALMHGVLAAGRCMGWPESACQQELRCALPSLLACRLCAVALAKGLHSGGWRHMAAVWAHGSRGAGLLQGIAGCACQCVQACSPDSGPPPRPPQGNAWQQLWASAAPVPASRQRPLFDARLEGERALHFLETLPPPALFAELLALGFSAAVQVLGALGPTAELPAVRRQLECLAEAAGPQLRQGVAAVLDGEASSSPGSLVDGVERHEDAAVALGSSPRPNKSSSGAPRSPQRQPSWVRSLLGSGLSPTSFRRLLLLLGAAEQTAVAAQSLLLRLAQPQQQGSSKPDAEFAAAVTDGLVTAALGEPCPQQQQQLDAEAGPAAAAAAMVQLTPGQRAEAGVLLTRQEKWQQVEDGASNAASSREEEGWPEPFQREWLVQVQSSGGVVPHRMYAKSLPSEVRLATVLYAEGPC